MPFQGGKKVGETVWPCELQLQKTAGMAGEGQRRLCETAGVTWQSLQKMVGEKKAKGTGKETDAACNRGLYLAVSCPAPLDLVVFVTVPLLHFVTVRSRVRSAAASQR